MVFHQRKGQIPYSKLQGDEILQKSNIPRSKSIPIEKTFGAFVDYPLNDPFDQSMYTDLEETSTSNSLMQNGEQE